MKQTSDIAFEPDWLALREPADHAARDANLLARAAREVAQGGRIVDMGSGTGSTLRAFEAAGFTALNWHLLDNDATLLGIAKDRAPSVATTLCDLGDIDTLPFDGAHLVTASALLDLMSQAWVERLADALRAANLPLYAALNYDGQMSWSPSDPDDDAITNLFNTHQLRDKGSGAALGPTSGPKVAAIFKARGFDVMTAQSPWVLGPDQADLQRQHLKGIANATAQLDESVSQNWHLRRKSLIKQSQTRVGHLDILAVPPC